MTFKHKRLAVVLLLGLLMMLVVACGGAAEPAAPVAPAQVSEAESAAEVDLASLPPEVDVQTVADIKDREDVVVLDVREQYEYDAGHIPGVVLIPMNEVPNRLSEIPKDKEVIVTCRTGNRSGQVTDFLRQQGFDNVHNMAGGIVAWEQAGLPVNR